MRLIFDRTLGRNKERKKPMTRDEFAKRISENGILVLDGATGTNLMRRGMPKGVCTEAWALEHPDIVEELQNGFIEAGSEVVYAPTFSCNRHQLKGFGLEGNIKDMNRDLVRISQGVARGRAYVAGDVAPTGLVLESIGGDATIEQVFDIYKEQITYLAESGVDLLVIETMMSMDESTIALDAANEAAPDLPVMVTMSVQADGTAYYGGTIYEAVEVFDAMGASAVGVNCCSGPDQLISMIRMIADSVSVPVIAKPNAGMPHISPLGMAEYDMDAETFAGHMKALKEAGASVLGGCCGTTPEYIRDMVALVK